jgi:hypothetical protein
MNQRLYSLTLSVMLTSTILATIPSPTAVVVQAQLANMSSPTQLWELANQLKTTGEKYATIDTDLLMKLKKLVSEKGANATIPASISAYFKFGPENKDTKALALEQSKANYVLLFCDVDGGTNYLSVIDSTEYSIMIHFDRDLKALSGLHLDKESDMISALTQQELKETAQGVLIEWTQYASRANGK